MLNEEQKKIIEESMWVINAVLKAYNLSHDEDMRQSAILYMCECIERFDPSKAKFTTYAFKNISLFVRRKKKNAPTIEVCDKSTEAPDISVKAFYETLTDEEAELLRYKYIGYQRREILQKMTLSPKRYTTILKAIKEKAKAFYAPP